MIAFLLAAALVVPAAQSGPGATDWTTPETRAQSIAHARALHARLDADHDGYVTLAEINRAALAWIVPKGSAMTGTVPPSSVARHRFDAVDADHDGRLSMAEEVAGASRAFDRQDTDHDGLLSPEERGAAMGAAIEAEQAELSRLPAMPRAR